MYHLKPILTPVDIEIPTCMYPVKRIHNYNSFNSNPLEPSMDSTEDDPELKMLEAKQVKVLNKLAELRAQLVAMKTELQLAPAKETTSSKAVKISEAKPKSLTRKIEPINLSYLQDFVVNASPENIPYGLLALKKLWVDRLDLYVECFTHSTIPQLSEEALNFQTVITSLEPKVKNLPRIKVTLIWKNVGTYTEMITSPTAYVPICGEVNILRFLSRCGPSEFNYERHDDVTEADSILDSCYLLINKQNLKEKKQVLKTLNSKLGKTPNFGGEEISLCDIAATSAIKQVQAVLAKDINPNMMKLISRVSSTVGI